MVLILLDLVANVGEEMLMESSEELFVLSDGLQVTSATAAMVSHSFSGWNIRHTSDAVFSLQ